MIDIVGIKFRKEGHIHFFKSGKYQLRKGDRCWAETDRGTRLGTVAMATVSAYPSLIPEELSKVMAIVDPDERPVEDPHLEKERESFNLCQDLIIRHELPMKLVKCSFSLDGNNVIFFFTADGRVDFRSLLKDLARQFKARIELRQIGVRDESKILGGIGTCGRTLCCATWIEDFRPVSIKMAKQQKLSLDPQKISGVCGRLKCCLGYEVHNGKGCPKKSTESSKRGIEGCWPNDKRIPGPYDPPL